MRTLSAMAAFVLAQFVAVGAALATTCSTSNPNSYTTLSNGTTASAVPVMGNFDYLLYCANTNLAPLASPQFSGNVGIGVAPSSSNMIYAVSSSTATSGTLVGAEFNPQMMPASASLAYNFGYRSIASWSGSASSPSGLMWGAYLQPTLGGSASLGVTYGIQSFVVHNGSGTATVMEGGNFSVDSQGTGVVTYGYGIYVGNTTYISGSRITNSYGVYVAGAYAGAGSGSITNNYGLYLEAQAPAGASVNYTLYSAGGTNYFGGNVGVATASPAYPLDVTGDIRTSACLRYNSGTLGTCTSDLVLSATWHLLLWGCARSSRSTLLRSTTMGWATIRTMGCVRSA